MQSVAVDNMELSPPIIPNPGEDIPVRRINVVISDHSLAEAQVSQRDAETGAEAFIVRGAASCPQQQNTLRKAILQIQIE